MQVDTVQQRPGQLAPVALDLLWRALAATGRVTLIAAGTGVHGGNQLEAGGEGQLFPGPGHMDHPRLQRFAQHLQHLAIEFRQFVEKEHPMVGLADLAGARVAATADQCRSGCPMMGRTEGAGRPAVEVGIATDGLYGCYLQRLLLVQRRQDAGQAAGQQGLAGAGRAEQQQVVAARRRDYQGPFGLGLALYLGQVRYRCRLGEAGTGLHRRQFPLAAQVFAQLEQVIGGDDAHPGHQGGFGGVGPGHQQGALLVSAGQGGGQDSLHRAQLPGQGQLAEGFAVLQAVCGDLVAGHQQAEGDGQVEAAAFLGQIGWGEVDGDALEAGKVEAGVLQRAADPILALTYCGLRHADQSETGHAIGQVDFNSDWWCLNSQFCATVNNRQGH